MPARQISSPLEAYGAFQQREVIMYEMVPWDHTDFVSDSEA